MARINVDDKLFTDIRFLELIAICGDRRLALGIVLEAYIVAQEYWKKDRSLIPAEKWKSKKLDDRLIACGLAEKKEHGIYLRGSEKMFGWLISRVENGRVGGKSKAASRTSKINKIRSSEPVANSSETKPLYSLLSSLKENNTYVHLEAELPHPLFEIWNSNCGGLVKIKSMRGPRLKQTLAAWKQEPNPNYWLAVLKKIVASDFLNGRSGGSWQASFDWVIKPGNHTRVYEGQFDNRTGKSKSYNVVAP